MTWQWCDVPGVGEEAKGAGGGGADVVGREEDEEGEGGLQQLAEKQGRGLLMRDTRTTPTPQAQAARGQHEGSIRHCDKRVMMRPLWPSSADHSLRPVNRISGLMTFSLPTSAGRSVPPSQSWEWVHSALTCCLYTSSPAHSPTDSSSSKLATQAGTRHRVGHGEPCLGLVAGGASIVGKLQLQLQLPEYLTAHSPPQVGQAAAGSSASAALEPQLQLPGASEPLTCRSHRGRCSGGPGRGEAGASGVRR